MKTIGSIMTSWLGGGRRLRHRLRPFVRYLALLVLVVVLYGWIFHLIMAWEGQEHSWFTGIYWALTVMSTLGFGDITFQSDVGRLFSTVVLLSGVVLLLVILPFLFIQYVYGPWIEDRIRNRADSLRGIPDDMRDHVLICSNDPIAPGLIERLELAGVPAYLIEPDLDRAVSLYDSGRRVVTGEVDSLETYRAAGAERCRLVLANASDTVNSNIVLTVREFGEALPVVATAEVEDSIDVLELSGATHVLPLTHQLGEHLANRVSAGVARANVIGKFHDLALAEFPVNHTPLEGQTVREAGLREVAGVTVVGVWKQGRLETAAPDTLLTHLCAPVVMGTPAQIERLNEQLVIYDANPNPVLVIGGGKVGRSAAAALKRREIPVHIVEKDPSLQDRIGDIPDRLILGDAADRTVLGEAGIDEAPAVLLTTHDDAMNVYLTVYCRRLNPDARILTRVTHERNVEAIRRAGADVVLSYASFGAQTVFSIVRGQELVVLGEGVDLFYMPVPPGLAGRTLAEADIRAKTGLNVIAIHIGKHVVTNPLPGQKLPAGSELVALGSTGARERFKTTYA